MTRKQWIFIVAGLVVFIVIIAGAVALQRPASDGGTAEAGTVVPVKESATKMIEEDYSDLVAQSIRTQTESYAGITDQSADLSDLIVTRLDQSSTKTTYELDIPSAQKSFIATVETSVDGYNNPSVHCPEADQKKYDTPCEEHYHE